MGLGRGIVNRWDVELYDQHFKQQNDICLFDGSLATFQWIWCGYFNTGSFGLKMSSILVTGKRDDITVRCKGFLVSLFKIGFYVKNIFKFISSLCLFDWSLLLSSDKYQFLALFLKWQTDRIFGNFLEKSVKSNFEIRVSESLQDLFSVNMSSAIDSLQIFWFDCKANMFTYQSLSKLVEDVQKTVFEFSRDICNISFYLSKEVVIDFVKIEEKVLFGSCILYGRWGSGRRSLVSSKNI